jgi:hypothetical protein
VCERVNTPKIKSEATSPYSVFIAFSNEIKIAPSNYKSYLEFESMLLWWIRPIKNSDKKWHQQQTFEYGPECENLRFHQFHLLCQNGDTN